MGGEAYTKASGVPRVISSSAGKALLALTEAKVRSDLGALEPAEQDAALARRLGSELIRGEHRLDCGRGRLFVPRVHVREEVPFYTGRRRPLR